MATTNKSASKNNNPTGKNQYSGGLKNTVRNNPIASAAAAGVAAAAGLFLWTKRDRISEQASKAGEKVGEWRQGREKSSSGKSTNAMGVEGSSQTAASGVSTTSTTGSAAVGSHAGKAQSRAPEVSSL